MTWPGGPPETVIGSGESTEGRLLMHSSTGLVAMWRRTVAVVVVTGVAVLAALASASPVQASEARSASAFFVHERVLSISDALFRR